MNRKLLVVWLFCTSIFMSGQNLLLIPDTISGTNFNLNVFDTSNVFYPGYTTNTYGINAKYLGPTLILNKGDSVSIQVNNQLTDTTTIHWHGLHVSAMNDGGPHNTIPPGTIWNPTFKVRDNAATYWYHPHLHMMTNKHVSLGAAGLIIVKDSIENSLNIPRTYGSDDFPLVIQSKCFDVNKQIIFGNASDSVILVNGTINPYLPVSAQVIRFRILNASPERVYNFGLQGNLTFYQIGTDGGLLDAPVALNRLRLAPGERAEILVDFTNKIGQTINLMSYASELPNAIYGASQPGMGAGQTIPGYISNNLNGTDFNIISFNVIAQTTAPVLSIPSSLTVNSPYNTTSANAFRNLTFSPVNMGPTAIQGPFLINNTTFDMDVINYTIPLNNIEIWTLTNQTPIAHPFHIHDVQFYITEINGTIPPANMRGRKDVVHVPGGGQTVKFITKFETFCDSMASYMYHCHMLTHEDDGMMGQFVVKCPDNVGIAENDLNTSNFFIYSNHTDKNINIKSNQLISEVKLIDISGKIIFHADNIKSTEFVIDNSIQASGIYFIELKISNKIYNKKIILFD